MLTDIQTVAHADTGKRVITALPLAAGEDYKYGKIDQHVIFCYKITRSNFKNVESCGNLLICMLHVHMIIKNRQTKFRHAVHLGY